MTMRYSRSTIDEVHSLFHLGAMGAWADGKLVRHFLSGQAGGDVAFRVLIHRHGPMVLSACRRILGDAHAAEDAFQATFLVLVKKAGSIQGRDCLVGWLYGVALRVSKKARAQTERRRVVERDAAGRSGGSSEDRDPSEIRLLIDEEIRRLPERYREPLVLCYLEGLRHHEIAERLDCPVGTVESRLSRARERLRSRLARRGLATTAGFLGMVLRPSTASSAVPASLVEATVRASTGLGSSKVVAKAAVVASTAGATSWHPSGALVASLVASVGIVIGGLGAYRAWLDRAQPGISSPPGPIPPPVTAPPAPPQGVEPPRPSRPDSAIAVPLNHITLDGRLDDWPTHLPRYPVSRVLVGNSDYDPGVRGAVTDPEAHFQAGYDLETQRIYLAVTVKDADPEVVDGTPWQTDAVEIYVEGLFTDRISPNGKLNASTMPVLQYVGLPGPFPAYKDPKGSNPSLLYGKLADTTTKMAYHRQGDVTTYEWAVQVFDRYPDQPTRLEPGKRIGLEVVVVDKDHDRDKPHWLHWGPAPTRFKGLDASSLGELILVNGP